MLFQDTEATKLALFTNEGEALCKSFLAASKFLLLTSWLSNVGHKTMINAPAKKEEAGSSDWGDRPRVCISQEHLRTCRLVSVSSCLGSRRISSLVVLQVQVTFKVTKFSRTFSGSRP